jgi:hypothetical protein
MIAMRGKRDNQGKMFFTIDVEARVRADHPLRSLKRIVDQSARSFRGRHEKGRQVGRGGRIAHATLHAIYGGSASTANKHDRLGDGHARRSKSSR